MADGEKVLATGDKPLRVTAEAVKYLSSIHQFHRTPDSVLICLAEHRTRLRVPDRWVAIALILSNRIPIPVPPRQERPYRQPGGVTTRGGLMVITGEELPMMAVGDQALGRAKSRSPA